jgi:hypothetical protein
MLYIDWYKIKHWTKACQMIYLLIGMKSETAATQPGRPRALGPRVCGFLFRNALPNIFAVNVRFTKAGTNAFMMRFIRPGTILDRFSRSALRPSDTHCSTLIGFIGMVRGSIPSLASTAVFVSGGGTTVT